MKIDEQQQSMGNSITKSKPTITCMHGIWDEPTVSNKSSEEKEKK